MSPLASSLHLARNSCDSYRHKSTFGIEDAIEGPVLADEASIPKPSPGLHRAGALGDPELVQVAGSTRRCRPCPNSSSTVTDNLSPYRNSPSLSRTGALSDFLYDRKLSGLTVLGSFSSQSPGGE